MSVRPRPDGEGVQLAAEVLQFAVFMGVFAVVAALWLYIVYFPGRTLERWEDQRSRNPQESREPQERQVREKGRL